METKPTKNTPTRIRPIIAGTVDPTYAAFVRGEAKRHRRTVTSILEEAIEELAAQRGVVLDRTK